MTEQLPLVTFAWFEVFLAGISTLAIFSFLYRENPFYRLFEHLFIGIATAIGVMAGFKYFLWPEVFKPLLGFSVLHFPDGTPYVSYNKNSLFFLFPMGFGLLYYFILSRRYSWIAQLVIGFGLGVSGGNAFKGFFTEVMPQLQDSFRPLIVTAPLAEEPLLASLSNIVFSITLLCSMSYFFFTFRRGAVMERSAVAGRLLMMCCFGAFFGATIMARMALLVERIQFLIIQWWPAVF